MILTRIQIENYKQYTGSNQIEIPAHGTVGVIGENGSGKTTLFEAIEWCLYSPRAISASDVRPRSAPGPTTVTVHLESIDGSQRFVVERVLKRTPSATLYRVDESGELEKIVEGPRQVTDYVAARLIGLSHTAFTATFFTRQKELHLFGDQTPGKRREEVGRLLGLETIRAAQRRFTQERSRANNEARLLAEQYARESQGRNFVAEMAEATATIESSSAQVAVSAEATGTARAAVEQAEAALVTAQDRREQDTTIAQALGERGRERQAQQTQLTQVLADIAHLDARARERAELAPTAARLPELRERITIQDQERARFDRATELDRRRRDIDQRRRDQNATVHSAVEGVGRAPDVPGWLWSADDSVNAIDGVRRLLGVVDAIDVRAVDETLHQLRNAAAAAEQLDRETSILRKYQAERDKIDREVQALLVNGDPGDELPRLDQERESLQRQRTTLDANRTTLEGDRDGTLQILNNLEQRHFRENCPTCGRPFSDDDASVVVVALRQRVDDISRRIAEVLAESSTIATHVEQSEKRRKEVFALIEKVTKARQRIENSETFLDRQREASNEASNALERSLRAAGLNAPPSERDLADAATASKRSQALVGARHGLATCLRAFTAFEEEERAIVAERVALGEVAFDQDAYRALVAASQEADRAQAQIAQIDRELDRRPHLEAAQTAASNRLTELDDEIAKATAQRTVLGYDPVELATAQDDVARLRTDERATIEAYHRSQSDLRHAEMRRDMILKEQERLARLAEAADARQSEADNLELMAREFTEFERFAASRKVPVLGELTSAIVRGITDGRYERVEFDQDFGIVVFDGEDSESSYAVDTFSGGERDAITLAARIALSQMIGRQATNPPGFLVLDEVFGSLDSDRRAHLLDLLGSISTTFDDLRQVFIISHVDDVRTSPVLDELWRVEESPEGASQVVSLRPGADIDTL